MNIRIGITALVAVLALSGCIENGNGEKVGQITKVSKEGAVCPTWEAEIIRGGFSGGSGVQGQSFHFTIENNDALVKQVQDAMDHQREVKIHYRSEMFTACRSEHDNFLVSLEIVGQGERKQGGLSMVDDAQTPGATPAATPAFGDVDPDVVQLLKVQAELIKRLEAKVGH